MTTILDYTFKQEECAMGQMSKLERDHPDVFAKTNELCKVLGLYGAWKRINSARWEIAKVILLERNLQVCDKCGAVLPYDQFDDVDMGDHSDLWCHECIRKSQESEEDAREC